MKIYNPIRIDARESEELKAILNEIESLKRLKSEYVINYLDSFIIKDKKFKEYHVVNNLYKVRTFS